ncbi:MAG: UvrD-helicase domain-containing protein [Verrucomicrobiota bacterium]|jgi:ATP-dependent helicase/nuclease subunit A
MTSAPSQTRSLTPTQQRVIAARGNVLVMAGAGTGKTKTLIERCLDCLERHGARLEELLVVTFTEAAAAELRDRLRRAIEARAQTESPGAPVSNPNADGWAEQLARFDLAHIGTLHSFCLGLVREHFYDLGLDPRLTLLDEGEARQLANETLAEQFAAHYAGEDEFSLAVQDLIQVHGSGRDESIRRLVLQLHHYSQARPDSAGWLARQRELFAAADPANWRTWLADAVPSWRQDWLPVLELQSGANEKAAELQEILARFNSPGGEPGWRAAAAGLMEQIAAAGEQWPKGRKTVLRKPLEAFFDEARFLQSLLVLKDGIDPLAEDWGWVGGQMQTVLRLAEEFAAQLADRKRTGSVLDFHDLEQFALRLLWDFPTDRPTPVALHWREKLKFVLVDEYQDINAAQDKIIQGLSRDGAAANRFLVGDVKQSIYRFRLADPKIFRDYARRWRGDAGQTIPLMDNFRSREGLLRLVNSIFQLVMRDEVGGVAYDAEAELKFGAPELRATLSLARDPAPRAELLLRLKRGRNGGRDEDAGALGNLDDTQREARMIAWRLRQFVDSGQEIFDAEQNALRPVKWRDIAILLRSPRGRSEIYAKECERARIPLAVARGGFYQSAEVLDLLSLLQLLDNPLQDVPCLAVLRSPLVGLSLDELAEVRLAAREKHFWTALNRSAERGLPRVESQAKITLFLQRFSRWRKLARLASLSQCLEEVLAETLYVEWLRAQPRGGERAAGIAAFLHLAQRFDQLQRQGLYRFLQFIEAQQEAEAEPEVPANVVENAVRLMSIHQSKGLEFPVVVLADLSKPFNEQDLRADIIFDGQFGVCPKVKPPHVGGRYPSLPHWLARRRQKRELRGEELRLFYVAATRARDWLMLAASIPEKSWDQIWTQPQPLAPHNVAAARCAADWLAMWFSNQAQPKGSTSSDPSSGELPFLRWRIVPDAQSEAILPGGSRGDEALAEIGHRQPASTEPPTPPGPAIVIRHSSFVIPDAVGLRSRLEWSYPFQAATRHQAKSSVTALRRQAGEPDDEAVLIVPAAPALPPRRPSARTSKLGAAEIGVAHHRFLEHFALEKVNDLAAEADRLVRENYLSTAERAALNLAALGAFWDSAPGRKILARPGAVRRELPFTARFSPLELARITGKTADAGLAGEFVIVQGVADLVVLQPRELWLVDFKTDDLTARELPQKVRIYTPQLQLYAAALEKIFARPVTLRALHFLALGRTEEV